MNFRTGSDQNEMRKVLQELTKEFKIKITEKPSMFPRYGNKTN